MRVTIATNMAGRGTDIKLVPSVAELGGLHLIATEHNESRRVDFQLIGRVARQGDPGSFQFFVSSDDALLLQYGGELSELLKCTPGLKGEITGNFEHLVRRAETLRSGRSPATPRADGYREVTAEDIRGWLR